MRSKIYDIILKNKYRKTGISNSLDIIFPKNDSSHASFRYYYRISFRYYPLDTIPFSLRNVACLNKDRLVGCLEGDAQKKSGTMNFYGSILSLKQVAFNKRVLVLL